MSWSDEGQAAETLHEPSDTQHNEPSDTQHVAEEAPRRTPVLDIFHDEPAEDEHEHSEVHAPPLPPDGDGFGSSAAVRPPGMSRKFVGIVGGGIIAVVSVIVVGLVLGFLSRQSVASTGGGLIGNGVQKTGTAATVAHFGSHPYVNPQAMATPDVSSATPGPLKATPVPCVVTLSQTQSCGQPPNTDPRCVPQMQPGYAGPVQPGCVAGVPPGAPPTQAPSGTQTQPSPAEQAALQAQREAVQRAQMAREEAAREQQAGFSAAVMQSGSSSSSQQQSNQSNGGTGTSAQSGGSDTRTVASNTSATGGAGAASNPYGVAGQKVAGSSFTSDTTPIGGLPGNAQSASTYVPQTSISRPSPTPPPPNYLAIQDGTWMPVALVSFLNLAIPGGVVAQVRDGVKDGTGTYCLAPPYSKLIGSFQSAGGTQGRGDVIWTKLRLPDGTEVSLDQFHSQDSHGTTGLSALVNEHKWEIARTGIYSTLAATAAGIVLLKAQPAQSGGTSVVITTQSGGQVIAQQVAQGVQTMAAALTQKDANKPDTYTVLNGTRFNVYVDAPIYLPPYPYPC
jgi:type IV secretory pathway VirB10-like protein